MMKIKQQDGAALTLEVSGKLTREDYAEVVPQMEKAVSEYGKIRALVEFNEFDGWTPSALVDELRFDVRHRKDIERIAILGEKKGHEMIAKVASPIFAGEVRYFPKEQIVEAKNWLGAA